MEKTMRNVWIGKIVNIGGSTNSASSMNSALISHLNIPPSDISKELIDVLDYYDTIESILEETYKALGERRIIEVSASLASNNMKIDVKSFGSIPPAEVSPRLA